MKTCSYEDKISDCQRTVYCKTLCQGHYHQILRGSQLKPFPADIPTEIRFLEKILFGIGEDSCWIWVAKNNGKGYGKFWDGNRDVYAHRFSYELMVGPIQENMVVDHTCWNPSCVNPAHLRSITQGQNIQNHRGARANSETGVRGVSWDKRRQKYVVQVWLNWKAYFGGYFTNLDEAEQAAKDLRNRLFTHNDIDRG